MSKREKDEHVEPMFAALGARKRDGSLRWKLVLVVIAVAALTALVLKQAF